MLNVLIAEDNLQISVHLSNMINTSNVRCVGILNDGLNVYKRIKELVPDVLILDLNLPKKSGLEVLQEIEADTNVKTKVFVYSGEQEYISLARRYQCVNRFYSKITPAEEIARELSNLENDISKRNTGDKIIDLLFKLGFTYSLKGTRLISDCILYSIVEKEDNMKNIYAVIAKKKGVNIHTIKADINTAISNMWRYTDRNNARRILRLGNTDKPSCKGIISMVKFYVEK